MCVCVCVCVCVCLYLCAYLYLCVKVSLREYKFVFALSTNVFACIRTCTHAYVCHLLLYVIGRVVLG